MTGDMGPVNGDMTGCMGDVTGCHGDMGPMMGDCSMAHGDMNGCSGDMTNIAGDMSPVTGDCSSVSGDVNGMQGDMTGCSGDMTGCTGDMSNVAGDMTDYSGDCATAAPTDFGEFDAGPAMDMAPVDFAAAPPVPMDPFDTGNPDFASPEMTEARAEVNDAAAVNGEGNIDVAPAYENNDFPSPPGMPINPVMDAGTPEGAADMAGGDVGGTGAMDDAFGGQPDTAAPMDINPADAALGAAMDSAMDQGGAPAGEPGITQEALDDPGYVDPAMDDDQDQDDGGNDIA
jgi:hypothetical protein